MLQKLALNLIKVYAYTFSIFCSGCCRFHPSCSQYAHTAISRFGLIKGGWIMCKRIARCHPWCHGGYDPVPQFK